MSRYKPFTTKYTLMIINEIKKGLEKCNDERITIDTLDICHLLGEIERLTNIINELEKWVNGIKYVDVEKYDVDVDVLLDKIKELKGVDKE